MSEGHNPCHSDASVSDSSGTPACLPSEFWRSCLLETSARYGYAGTRNLPLCRSAACTKCPAGEAPASEPAHDGNTAFFKDGALSSQCTINPLGPACTAAQEGPTGAKFSS